MIPKTWPFGETKIIEVADVVTGKMILGIEAETYEGFVLLTNDTCGAVVGMKLEIVFTEGGLTGGYWKPRVLEAADQQ